MAEAVAWLVRWVGFVALAGLVGGLAVDTLGLPAHAPELGAVRGRLRALRLGSALVLLAASGGELLLRAATMSGAGLGVAVAAVPAVLTRTPLRAVWSAPAVMLLALLAPAGAPPPAGGGPRRPPPPRGSGHPHPDRPTPRP